MRELVYYIAVSLDGYIAQHGGSYEPFLTDGDHSSVVMEEYADALPGHVHKALGTQASNTRFDSVIMGWNTLKPALEIGVSSPYPHLTQVVASRQQRDTASDVALTNDPLGTVRDLKQSDGLDIWLCGGGELAWHLLSEIDRLILKRHPLVFGSGVPLFGGAGMLLTTFPQKRCEKFRIWGSH